VTRRRDVPRGADGEMGRSLDAPSESDAGQKGAGLGPMCQTRICGTRAPDPRRDADGIARAAASTWTV